MYYRNLRIFGASNIYGISFYDYNANNVINNSIPNFSIPEINQFISQYYGVNTIQENVVNNLHKITLGNIQLLHDICAHHEFNEMIAIYENDIHINDNEYKWLLHWYETEYLGNIVKNNIQFYNKSINIEGLIEHTTNKFRTINMNQNSNDNSVQHLIHNMDSILDSNRIDFDEISDHIGLSSQEMFPFAQTYWNNTNMLHILDIIK